MWNKMNIYISLKKKKEKKMSLFPDISDSVLTQCFNFLFYFSS